MYRKILVALDNTPTDAAIVSHVLELAQLCHSELLLVHVADGFAARHFKDLNLRESEEIRSDREYLAGLASELAADSIVTSTELAMGDPATELIRLVNERNVDLLAMATHGHRLFNDLVRGTTVSRVRHEVKIPVLLLRAQ